MPSEQMNTANLLQLIREAVPGTYDSGGERLVMTSLRGDFAPEEAWASFRPSGFNEDAWHAMERTHNVWTGTVRWDYKQAPILFRMLCGAPISDEVSSGKRTRVYTLPESGARNLDGSTFTIEYGQQGSCERCTYGLLVALSLPAERTADTVEGQITIICRRAADDAVGVSMTGVTPANEVQRITFTNTPNSQFLQLKVAGGVDTFNFQANITTNDLETGIEGLDELAGQVVVVTDNRTTNTDPDTGETRQNGYVAIEFAEDENVPQLQVLSGEVQRLVVEEGDSGNYKLNNGANFNLGDTESDLQTNQRNLGGNFANVAVKGASNDVSGDSYVVSEPGTAGWGGTYLPTGSTLEGAPVFSKDSSHFIFKLSSTSWVMSAVEGETTGLKYECVDSGLTPPLTGWVPGGASPGSAPSPTLTLTPGEPGNAYFNTYFPVSVGNVGNPTATGTDAVATTVQNGGIAASNTVGSTTTQGGTGIVIEARVPILNRNFSVRKASSLASLDAAAALNKAMMTSFDLGALVDPIWFFAENEETYLSHVDGAEPTRTLAIRLAKSSTDLVAMETGAYAQPATPAWYQLRAVHADDSDYSFKAEFFASPSGAASLGAGGNIRYKEFPFSTVIHGGGFAARFILTEPAS